MSLFYQTLFLFPLPVFPTCFQQSFPRSVRARCPISVTLCNRNHNPVVVKRLVSFFPSPMASKCRSTNQHSVSEALRIWIDFRNPFGDFASFWKLEFFSSHLRSSGQICRGCQGSHRDLSLLVTSSAFISTACIVVYYR